VLSKLTVCLLYALCEKQKIQAIFANLHLAPTAFPKNIFRKHVCLHSPVRLSFKVKIYNALADVELITFDKFAITHKLFAGTHTGVCWLKEKEAVAFSI
jgi:hypothetical protein